MRGVTYFESDRRDELIERDGNILDAYEQSKTFGSQSERKDFGGVGVWEGVERDTIKAWMSAFPQMIDMDLP